MSQQLQLTIGSDDNEERLRDSTALVLHSDTRVAVNGPGRETVAAPTRNLEQRAAEMKQRQLDRQRHHHSQIWTKGAHGGPYRKVSCTSTISNCHFQEFQSVFPEHCFQPHFHA